MLAEAALPSSSHILTAAARPFDLVGPRSERGYSRAGQPITYSANAVVYAQGDVANAVYRVDAGTVRIYRLLSDGRRQISAFHVPGEFFGFATDGTHHFFAEAVGRCEIRAFPRPVEPEVARVILPIALRALERTQEHLLVIGRQSAAERVAAFLLDMMERQGSEQLIELGMSRTDIADYLGLTIETVSRAFSRFKQHGLIRLKNARAVYITDVAALRCLCA